jgi:lauroyl/myristoyl acyltransferase
MWLYYLLKAISTAVSLLPYKLVVQIGRGLGHIYYQCGGQAAYPRRRNHQRAAGL